MQRSVGVLIVTAAAFLLAAPVHSATRGIPPLYPESRILENSNGLHITPREDFNYRLPNNTVPDHYDVVLTTRVDEGIREFTGVVTIDLDIVEETNSIVLHARLLNITSAKIQTGTATAEVLTHTYEEEREFLTLTRQSSTPFPKDTRWKLTLEYEGRLRYDNGGFYISTYTDAEGKTRYLATTQFESTDARHAFPCFDEPAKRANFTITINHSPSYSAVSNMPVNEAASTAGKTVFLTTPKMPTYIIAFIVSDFKYTEGVLNGLKQRVYSRPGTEHDQEWSLVSGMLIAERLSSYLGVDFMLPKLDQAALPDFSAGGMENWGLATYREEYVLYNKDTSSVSSQTNIAQLIAHEYCHQWFGDYVAIAWWSSLWLKEGFATLFGYRATDDAYPEWGIWQQFQTDDYQSALVSDAGNNPRPMTYYIEKPSQISSVYDTVSYAKAGSVLYMWNHALTDKVFQRGLHNFLDANQYSYAEEDQLFNAMQIAAKEENYAIPATMENMLRSWTRQGGYPLLTVTRNYDDGSFTVSQQPFFNDATNKAEKTWYIPFNYAVQSKADFRNTEATDYLLNVASVKVSVGVSKDDWLILNKQSTGYYRINYDERNWNLIVDGLLDRPYRIHPRNRAQLMHDAYRFSSTNRLAHSILLKMLTYLPSEHEYAPWSTANGIISTYDRYFRDDARYADFQKFASEIISPIYERLGINDVPGEHHMQKYTRNAVINMACLVGIESCLKETNDKLTGLVEHGTPIEPNLQSQIYCNGLKQSNNNVFDFVYNQLMDSSDQALRRILVSALGCSQTKSHLEKYVSSSIDANSKLRTQERITILRPVYSRGPIGLQVCIDFLDANWQAYGALESGFGGSNPLDSDIRGMSTYVMTSDQEKQLLALVEKVKGSSYVTAGLEAAVQSNIKANTDWLKANRNPIMSWLTSYYTVNTDDGSATMTLSSVTIASALLLVVSRLF